MSMTTYDELVARGLVAQVTDEDELKELINTGKAFADGRKQAGHIAGRRNRLYRRSIRKNRYETNDDSRANKS